MKYYFIFCLYLIFILPSSAQERKERPQFKLGGALRFNYNFSDWNSGHRDRGGDLGYDVFMLRPTASYKGFLLDADCRFYSTKHQCSNHTEHSCQKNRPSQTHSPFLSIRRNFLDMLFYKMIFFLLFLIHGQTPFRIISASTHSGTPSALSI